MCWVGWGVWIVYDFFGFYEELLLNLLDEFKCDCCWCYGNLMNFCLFLVKGMYLVYCVVFLMGVMLYLFVLLWFMFFVFFIVLQVVYVLIEL